MLKFNLVLVIPIKAKGQFSEVWKNHYPVIMPSGFRTTGSARSWAPSAFNIILPTSWNLSTTKLVSFPAQANNSHFFFIVSDTKFPWSSIGTRSSCVILYLSIKCKTCHSFTVKQYLSQVSTSRDIGNFLPCCCELCMTWWNLSSVDRIVTFKFIEL